MIALKARDSEVLRVQHSPLGAERQTAETPAPAAPRAAGAMSSPVRQGPLGASTSVGHSRRPPGSVAPPPARSRGREARTPLARVRAPSVQLVRERKWEEAGLRLWPCLLTDPARRLQP